MTRKDYTDVVVVNVDRAKTPPNDWHWRSDGDTGEVSCTTW